MLRLRIATFLFLGLGLCLVQGCLRHPEKLEVVSRDAVVISIAGLSAADVNRIESAMNTHVEIDRTVVDVGRLICFLQADGGPVNIFDQLRERLPEELRSVEMTLETGLPLRGTATGTKSGTRTGTRRGASRGR